MVVTVSYRVEFSLETLETHLHSEFLKKIKDELHVNSLSEAHVLATSLNSDICLFTIGEKENA